MNEPNIVILAGGSSSRMKRPYGNVSDIDPMLLQEVKEKSKSMLGVGIDARPFLDYVLTTVERSGYREVVIVVGEQDISVQDYYQINNGARQFPNLNISYVVQQIPVGRVKPLGTADALVRALLAKPTWKHQSFTVCNSDNLYSENALTLL